MKKEKVPTVSQHLNLTPCKKSAQKTESPSLSRLRLFWHNLPKKFDAFGVIALGRLKLGPKSVCFRVGFGNQLVHELNPFIGGEVAFCWVMTKSGEPSDEL